MPQTPPPTDDKNYHSVMTHFYRGELGRIMLWRQRLDVTTNWAILATTGIITFALGSRQNSHLVFLLANALSLLLLMIEGRRYRYYDSFRARVRMLEAHFLMPVVIRNSNILQGDWRRVMAEDLITPSFKLGKMEAIASRFLRNYLYIFLIIALGWGLKIWLHVDHGGSFFSFLKAFLLDNPMPSWLFIGILVVFYGFLAYLFVLSLYSDAGSREFQRGVMRGQRWIK